MYKPKKLAAGTNGSVRVEECQVCGSSNLSSVLFVGYLPPVNTMPPVGERPNEQPAYPAELLRCGKCTLVQLGLVVDPAILFPPTYPYTSGTTRILRENFAELCREATPLVGIKKDDLVVDVGSNDGTLLGNFKDAGFRVCGVEPTNASKIALEKGIDSIVSFFGPSAVAKVKEKHGQAKVVTAANVFAHIEDVHTIVSGIVELLGPGGVFISESHYLVSLLETLQYDTIYHEHLRYYALGSLQNLLAQHGLEVFHAKRIPTHGGSIRVYAARKGEREVRPSVAEILAMEERALSPAAFEEFKRAVVRSKLELHALLKDVKGAGKRVDGVGAPSRSSTLINYVGLDDGIIDSVLEIKGSYKIGKYVPGTLIPVLDESKITTDAPDYLLLFSWHIADELMPKLKKSGFKGDFIIPLPQPRIVSSASVG
ncbi:MAG TPA: class I SAM-dependent methyltransferase [Labilithrix sp.]|nr:class I SAM-dependent methyltransferase [Labilithrix sp.]